MSKLALRDFASNISSRSKGYATISKSVAKRNEEVMKKAKIDYKNTKKELEYENTLEKTNNLRLEIDERRKPVSKFKQFLNKAGAATKGTREHLKKSGGLNKSPVQFRNTQNISTREPDFDSARISDKLKLKIER